MTVRCFTKTYSEKTEFQKGVEKARIELVINLTLKLGRSDKAAASAAGMPVALVKKVRLQLER